MLKLEILTGKRVGRLTVIGDNPFRDINGRTKWLCQCDCGNETIVFNGNLTRFHTQSCGCLKVDAVKTHGDSYVRLYKIWDNMKKRCHNQNGKQYHNYGGRGISVCNEWNYSYEAFKEWAFANGYSDNLTLDRKDNDKGYIPENCQRATRLEQSHNTGMFNHNTSGVKGVTKYKNNPKWIAKITANHKNINLGSFDTIEEAAIARREAEIKYWNK